MRVRVSRGLTRLLSGSAYYSPIYSYPISLIHNTFIRRITKEYTILLVLFTLSSLLLISYSR
jgi:hypothetical protein